MFSMLENARTREPSLCTRACQAAHRAVIAAIPITSSDSRCWSPTPTMSKMMRTRTRTATLEAAVESKAVTVEGERLYRSGIQMWNGNRPSLLPNPRNTMTMTIADERAPSDADRPCISLRRTSPEDMDRKARAAIIKAAPKWVIARYFQPAAVSWSSREPQAPRKEVKDMASQATSRRSMWSATMANRTDSMKKLKSEAPWEVIPSRENMEYMATQANVSEVMRSTSAPSASRRMA